MVDDRVGERRRKGRRATIKALPGPPSHPRPYGHDGHAPKNLPLTGPTQPPSPLLYTGLAAPASYSSGEGGAMGMGGPLRSPCWGLHYAGTTTSSPQPEKLPGQPQGQCHLNKKNLMKEVPFESEARVPELFAVEGMEGTFDHPRIKAQATGGQQGRRLAQVPKQALLKLGELLTGHHRELIAGRLQDLQRMGETELVGI